MSLKIDNATGFKIGGVDNPSITTIYVRCLCDMKQQNPIEDSEGNMAQIEVNTEAKTTILGGLFDAYVKLIRLRSLHLILFYISVNDLAFHAAPIAQIDDDFNIIFSIENIAFNNRIINNYFKRMFSIIVPRIVFDNNIFAHNTALG